MDGGFKNFMVALMVSIRTGIALKTRPAHKATFEFGAD